MDFIFGSSCETERFGSTEGQLLPIEPKKPAIDRFPTHSLLLTMGRGLTRAKTKVHTQKGLWDWNGCQTETCHAPAFMTAENGFCIDCNTRHRRMGAELPRGDNQVLRDLETWSLNGLDCNPLKTWQLLRESVNLQNTMSKMSMHDIKDALTRPEALKALKEVVPNAEAVRGMDIQLNEYFVIVEAMIDSISASSRQWREHEMDFVRNFKSLQQVKDEVAKLTDDDLVAQVHCWCLIWLLALTTCLLRRLSLTTVGVCTMETWRFLTNSEIR